MKSLLRLVRPQSAGLRGAADVSISGKLRQGFAATEISCKPSRNGAHGYAIG